jgi:hypothetical protein
VVTAPRRSENHKSKHPSGRSSTEALPQRRWR